MLLRHHSSASIPDHTCVRLTWEMSTAQGELKANAVTITIAEIAMTMAIMVIATDDLSQIEKFNLGPDSSGPRFLRSCCCKTWHLFIRNVQVYAGSEPIRAIMKKNGKNALTILRQIAR
jgi:hypothetical protein